MSIYISDLNVEEPKALWYPKEDFKTIIVGRSPSTPDFLPEPFETVHWRMTDISDSFSRRMVALFCSFTGSLTIVRLTKNNSVYLSSDYGGEFLRYRQRYTVSPMELNNFTITLGERVVIKTQSVGWSSFERPRILTMVRQS